MNVTIRTKREADSTTLYLQGEVDAYTAPSLRERLMLLVESPDTGKVTVDLALVTYMDSTGIGIFIGARKAAQKTNCKLEIANPTPPVERVFRITGLSEIIPIISLKGDEA